LSKIKDVKKAESQYLDGVYNYMNRSIGVRFINTIDNLESTWEDAQFELSAKYQYEGINEHIWDYYLVFCCNFNEDDQGVYLCSIRTMYRILEAEGEVRERRNQLRRPHYQKPELIATEPNQVWSWDITKLKGPAKWVYYYLYVIMDIFSRYVVGWMVAHRESETLAKRLIDQTCNKQDIVPGQLTIHADRGSSMTSKSVAQLMADLGITKTHSRPHVSNDNPYSEAQFKTLKYRPGFPERFGSIEDSRAFCQDFFPWYNTEHYHTGIGLLTPESVHYGWCTEIIEARAEVLLQAFQANPQRFKGKKPKPPELPQAAWINRPKPADGDATIRH